MARYLDMQCARCKVAPTCPRRGSSPMTLEGGRRPVFCRIVGGYGTQPLDDAAMSEETRRIRDRDGPCLTLAEVPTKDQHTGHVYAETVKVFHKQILHPRQQTNEMLDRIYPRSHKP